MSFSAVRQQFIVFFNQPLHPAPLGIFRMLIAAFTLLQAFLWYADWQAFLGKDAWIQWEISKAVVPEICLHISQVATGLTYLGMDENQAVMTFFWIYAVCAFGLLLGYFTRFWAIFTWLCHYVIMCSIDIYVYGVDIFLQISLFYCMLMPVQKAFSLDALLRNIDTSPTWGVTLSVRVLQIHLCLAYLSAGYEKMLSVEWWNGNVLWRSLVQPDFRQFDFTWLARYPWLAILLSWFTMFIETFYGIAMWIPRVRIYWLLSIIALHIGICLFLGLWLFGLIMILLSISAFGFDIYQDLIKGGKIAGIKIKTKDYTH